MNRLDIDWLQGRASLGAAAGWTPEEIRLVADLGYALAEQGRHEEAITVFEGLAALAPATGYFQAALGALRLRTGDPHRALTHLNAALAIDPRDYVTLVNRGEAYLLLNDTGRAVQDLDAAFRAGGQQAAATAGAPMSLTRARALLLRLQGRV